MSVDKNRIYKYLTDDKIHYEVTEHRPVFNMNDLKEINIPYPDGDAKNIFVRDNKRQIYCLITVKGDKRVDLREFRRSHGLGPLSFVSPDELKEILGLTPGSVTPFGILNDIGCRVHFYLDSELDGKIIGVHPNDNTATVWLNSRDLFEIVEKHGNFAEITMLTAKGENAVSKSAEIRA